MVKSVISMIAVAIILVFAAFFETQFIHKEFDEFYSAVEITYRKIEEESAKEEDIYNLQQNWHDKKSKLHAFIPHNEIKEFDLWIAEAVKLVKEEMWEDALSKLEVIKELSRQVPKTFEISFANIF